MLSGGYTVQTIEDAIDKRIGEVRTEALDLSFGEIANLHELAISVLTLVQDSADFQIAKRKALL